MKAKAHICSPDEIALKSFFLGPQAENGDWVADTFQLLLERWFHWRRSKSPHEGNAISVADQKSSAFIQRRANLENLLGGILDRFENEVPKFSPRYIGHMFSEISLPALFGHCIALLHNPNNISGESSRVGIEIEEEAIADLLRMCGFDPAVGTGHFTSGGTVANFEAYIRAKHRIFERIGIACASKRQGLWRGSLWEASTMSPAESSRLRMQLDLQTDLSIYDPDFFSLRQVAQAIEKELGVFHEPVLLVPGHRHYSWEKIAMVAGFGRTGLMPIALDRRGLMSQTDLRANLERCREQQCPVAMVVSVAGTTEMGLVDPIHEIAENLEMFARSIWHHVDAAYGGFFCSLKDANDPTLSDNVKNSLRAIRNTTSLTIDPHKLGYVPYSCGAILIADQGDYPVNSQAAPYIQFESADKGHSTLEGSRSAAGALATWLTARAIGLDAGGYGKILARTIRGAADLRQTLAQSIPHIHFAPSDTNILCFCVGHEADTLAVVNARTAKISAAFSPRNESAFYVSQTTLDPQTYSALAQEHFPAWALSGHLKMIRLCLMNPFFTSGEPDTDYPGEFAAQLKKICEGI